MLFSRSGMSSSASPWTAARQAFLSIANSRSLLKLMSIESVMPSNHLILCPPLFLLPSIFPSIRIFSNESVHIRWPKHWSFSFSIIPSSEYSGLISFRMDWLDLLAFLMLLFYDLFSVPWWQWLSWSPESAKSIRGAGSRGRGLHWPAVDSLQVSSLWPCDIRPYKQKWTLGETFLRGQLSHLV